MQRKFVFFWIFCLTFVAVGIRNFELGLSSDGPIYSTIARNIIESHDWFFLDSSVPDYTPYFADHPHLGVWLIAASFKLFGVGDYSARIPGHLFYFAFLCLLFFYIRKVSNERTAFLTLLVLWIWGRFSNSFSAVYLDPGVHFFGFLGVVLLESALNQKRERYYFWSGICFSLVILMKGLTVLGYFPVLILLWGSHLFKQNAGFLFKGLALFFSGIFLPVSLYLFSLKHSSTPEFLEIYWGHQVTNRFAKIASFKNLFSSHFWKPLLEDTNYYSILLLLTIPKIFKNKSFQLLGGIALGFVLLYAPNKCSGAHYFIPIIPVLALGVALFFEPYCKFDVFKYAKVWSVVCILAVFILQYIPVRTHGMRPYEGEEYLFSLHTKKNVHTLWIDGTPFYTDFINSSRYTWWGHVKVLYVKNGEPVPQASQGFAYLLFWKDAYPIRKQSLLEKGWCLIKHFNERSVWLPCPIDPTEHLETVYEK